MSGSLALVALIALPSGTSTPLVVRPQAHEQDARAESQTAELERYVAALIEEYAGRGFEIDAARLRVEEGDPERTRAFFRKQQEALFPDGYFDAAPTLLRFFGLSAPADPEELRDLGAESIDSVLQAYYRYDERALVFLDTELTRIVGFEPLVAHELAHAWRDQQTPIADLLKDVPTLEHARTLECLLEGEAELISMDLLLARTGLDLRTIDMESFGSNVGRLLGGAFALAYEKGREFMHAIWLEGGWEATAACFRDPPTSTEQIVHPGKYGHDLPRTVELPGWPTTLPGATQLVHEDVIGELGLYRLLLGAGVEDEQAVPASVGWDGDRMSVYRLEGGWVALLWRSVWDREEDARQFRDVLDEHAEGLTALRGRVVDCVWTEDELLERELLEHLAAHPLEAAAVPEDERGTAAIEAAFLAEQGDSPRVVDGVWRFPRLGLGLPIPDSFEVSSVNGVDVLVARDREGGFAANINVLQLPNTTGTDMQAYLELNLKFLEASDALELISGELVEIGGRQVARLEYRGEIQGFACHFLALARVEEDLQWVVTGTGLEKSWEERGAPIREALTGLRLDGGDSD